MYNYVVEITYPDTGETIGEIRVKAICERDAINKVKNLLKRVKLYGHIVHE